MSSSVTFCFLGFGSVLFWVNACTTFSSTESYFVFGRRGCVTLLTWTVVSRFSIFTSFALLLGNIVLKDPYRWWKSSISFERKEVISSKKEVLILSKSAFLNFFPSLFNFIILSFISLHLILFAELLVLARRSWLSCSQTCKWCFTTGEGIYPQPLFVESAYWQLVMLHYKKVLKHSLST